MAIASIQVGSALATVAGTQILGTFSSPLTSANAVVLVIADSGTNNTVSSVIDDKSNTYTKLTAVGFSRNGEIWYASNITGAGSVVTARFTASVNSSFVMGEYSNILGGGFDVAGSLDNGNSTTIRSGTSPVTNQASELVVAGAGISVIEASITPSTGFTARGTAASSAAGVVETSFLMDKIVSATGAQVGTMTLASTIASQGVIATFKERPYAGTNLIQSTGTSGIGLTVLSSSWGGATTTGNMVVVGVTITNLATLGTVTSVVDTQGNVYSKAASIAGTAVKVLNTEIWYATNIIGGAGSVTVNLPLNAVSMYVREYSGGYNYLDVTSSAVGSSATLNSGTTAVVAQANELLIIASGDETGGTQTYQAAGNFGDMVGTTTTATGLCMSDQIVNTGGAQTGTNTMTVADEWVSVMATFRRMANPRYTPHGGGV